MKEWNNFSMGTLKAAHRSESHDIQYGRGAVDTPNQLKYIFYVFKNLQTVSYFFLFYSDPYLILD